MKVDAIQEFFDSLHPPCESQLLADFVHVNPNEFVLDIGCGNGFIALTLAYRFPTCKGIIGIDLQKQKIFTAIGAGYLLSEKVKNLAPYRFQKLDARGNFSLYRVYDVIVSNPPFFASQASRPCPALQRRLARQDFSLTLEGLFTTAKRILADQGRFYFVFPNNRMSEIEELYKTKGFDVLEIKPFPEIRKRSGGISLFAFQKRALP